MVSSSVVGGGGGGGREEMGLVSHVPFSYLRFVVVVMMQCPLYLLL